MYNEVIQVCSNDHDGHSSLNSKQLCPIVQCTMNPPLVSQSHTAEMFYGFMH